MSWKLQLNAEKSEVCAVSTWSNDIKWLPNLTPQDRNIVVNNTPHLLGILLDGNFMFSGHVDNINADFSSKLRAVKLVSHSTQGRKKSTLKTMYHAFIHTKMDYAALARKHWLSKTKMTRMESCQSCALCLATRKLISTPNEALQMEAKVQSYTTISQRNILKAKEKSLCWAADHLKLTFHCGFLHVPAGGEKQLSYPLYFLTSSTNINKLVCSLPLHGSYQPLKDTTT